MLVWTETRSSYFTYQEKFNSNLQWHKNSKHCDKNISITRNIIFKGGKRYISIPMAESETWYHLRNAAVLPIFHWSIFPEEEMRSHATFCSFPQLIWSGAILFIHVPSTGFSKFLHSIGRMAGVFNTPIFFLFHETLISTTSSKWASLVSWRSSVWCCNFGNSGCK